MPYSKRRVRRPTKSELSQIKDLSTRKLPQKAQDVINNIAELRDKYKLFSKMGATPSSSFLCSMT
jgi:hypothetical protein